MKKKYSKSYDKEKHRMIYRKKHCAIIIKILLDGAMKWSGIKEEYYKLTKKKIHDVSLKRVLRFLIEEHVLKQPQHIDYGKRGIYYINPEFRSEIVSLQLEKAVKVMKDKMYWDVSDQVHDPYIPKDSPLFEVKPSSLMTELKDSDFKETKERIQLILEKNHLSGCYILLKIRKKEDEK